MVINMLAYLVRRMDEYRVNFDRDRRHRKVPDKVTELKSTITELDNMLEGFKAD